MITISGLEINEKSIKILHDAKIEFIETGVHSILFKDIYSLFRAEKILDNIKKVVDRYYKCNRN